MTPYLSMAAFALASSITPGPVNLVALNCGARHGFVASLRHVTGATVGFTLLLLLIGLGLYEVLQRAPALMIGIQWGASASCCIWPGGWRATTASLAPVKRWPGRRCGPVR